MSPLDRLKARLARWRERSPALDHGVRAVEHYNEVEGNQKAGGVTYYGFLSVFPILALAFFAVGWISRVFPDARDTLLTAIDEVLPGLVGTGPNDVSLDSIASVAGRVGLIGLVGVLYAGLGWVSALRLALGAMFGLPRDEQPDFVRGKLRDLATLAVLGTVLLASVALSGVVTRTSGDLLDAIGLGRALGWVLTLLAFALGIAIGTLLFFLMFRLLAKPEARDRALWAGALVGALGFEVLKQASGILLAATRGQPAFQAFGIALILLVWINYFSRVVLVAAAWAHTDETSQTPERPDDTPREGDPT